MRRPVDRQRLGELMRRLGAAARQPATVYLTGGATALLLEWRATTIDVDLKVEPDSDEVLRAVAVLKEPLELNIELASPDDFVPALPEWRERSRFIAKEGPLIFRHYDFYGQALAKIERGHAQDVSDVREMFAGGLVKPAKLRELFEAVVPQLYRYPALDERSLRAALDDALAAWE
jgi:hypothetical protein